MLDETEGRAKAGEGSKREREREWNEAHDLNRGDWENGKWRERTRERERIKPKI